MERPWDDPLIEQLDAAGVRYRRQSADEHRHRERAWRAVYGHVFTPGLRHRHGDRATTVLVIRTLVVGPGQ